MSAHTSVTVLLTAIGLTAATAAMAADAAYDGDWRFALAPYAWLPNIHADLRFSVPPGAGGNPNVHVAPDTILSDLRFAFAMTGEARKGDWAIGADLIYVDLGTQKATVKEVSGPREMVSLPINASVDVNAKQLLAQGTAGYAAVRNESSTLDVFGGVRYGQVKTSLAWNLNGELGLLGRSGSLSEKIDLVDGIIGVRGQVAFGNEHRWFMPYYIDGGAGNNSNWTWQGYTGIGYRFSWGDVVLTYRNLYYATNGNRLVDNLRLAGPAIAATLRW